MAFDLVGKAVKKLRLPTVNYDNTPIKIIPAQQGDVNSRYFIVELYDDRGDIDLSPYNKVMLNATLPDESLQIAEGEINKEDNTLLIKIAGTMIVNSGKVVCDISLQGTDGNSETIYLTSQTFYIFVALSQAGDEAIEGDDNYSLLVQLLSDVSALENEVKTAEASRVEAETQREQNEATRQSQETARQSAESKRVTAENTRVANENARKTAETNRANAESARVEVESARVTAENARVSAETARATAETERANAETSRVAAESARVKAEEGRVAAEASRVEAETQREQDFSEAKTNCENATTRAVEVTETMLETMDSLPCATEVQDGDTTEGIVLLRFVKMEDSQ